VFHFLSRGGEVKKRASEAPEKRAKDIGKPLIKQAISECCCVVAGICQSALSDWLAYLIMMIFSGLQPVLVFGV
jgi:hypothetical protein